MIDEICQKFRLVGLLSLRADSEDSTLREEDPMACPGHIKQSFMKSSGNTLSAILL